ncbi:MAG: carboxypeptidase regulatory-like domain-containing protein [Acidobacteriota bacterium]
MARKIAWAAVAFFFLAGVALAQTSSIAGEVKGDDGQPLRDALIKIDRLDIKGNYKVKTNKKGEYFHAGLPLGNYRVVCEVNGQDVDKVDGVRTRLGDPTVVNFDLQKLKQKREALQRAAESGQLTAEQAREMTAEQRAALEKQAKERQAALSKNKELNDAFNTGMTALQAKQFQPAVDAFAKAAEIDAKQHVVWAHLADSYIGLSTTKTGTEQEAALAKGLETYGKALELKPDEAAYHNNFALALARAKKFDEAQAELTKAAQIDPPNAGRYFYNLGALLVNAGQNDPAGEVFKRAIEADPNYADAHYQYGVSLISKAQTTPDGKFIPPPGTREAFEKYLQLKPDGLFAESAKGMIASMETGIETKYVNPDAAKKKTKKK